MSEFKVIIENNGNIEFKNFFEFGQWEKIKEELKTLNKKLIKLHKDKFLLEEIKDVTTSEERNRANDLEDISL